jgi:hypothetical protein
VLYLNFSTRKLAALGIDQRQVMQSLQSQNAVTPAGVIEAGPERISVRTTGQFASEKDLETVNLRINDRFFRLADIADISAAMSTRLADVPLQRPDRHRPGHRHEGRRQHPGIRRGAEAHGQLTATCRWRRRAQRPTRPWW